MYFVVQQVFVCIYILLTNNIYCFMMFADFFDASSTKPDNIADVVSSKPTTMADLLPEGFFDDPKMDAKVTIIQWCFHY